MSEQRFKIKLNQIHRERGLSVYRVAKETGINKNTVLKYLGNGDVVIGRLESHVLELAKYYNVDWRDPSVIEVIEVDESDEA